MLIKRSSVVAVGYRLLPVALTVILFRYLIPTVAEAPPGASFHAVARLAAEQPIVMAAAALLCFSALAEYWSGYFLGARPPVEPRRNGILPMLLAMAVMVIAALAFGQAFRAARVLSTSMVPTILPSDRLWVDKLGRATTSHAPRRGEIIVFRHRGDGAGDGEDGALVKRVVGLPGDHVTMIDSRPVLNGHEVESCDAGTFVYFGASQVSRGHLVVEWLDGQPYLTIHEPGPHRFVEYDVKPGELFVLGDNRGVSNDSRSWQHGSGVAFADIEGRVGHVLFGADRSGRLDLGRLWRPLGTDLHLTGIDLGRLRAGIEGCLKQPVKIAQQ